MAENIKEEIENKILDYIVLGSGGRLLAVKPEDPKVGADLVVKRKGEYEAKKLEQEQDQQIIKPKAFGGKKEKTKSEINLIIKSQKEDFEFSKNLGKDFYLLLADFDFVKQDIKDKIKIIKLDGSKKEFLIDKKDLSQFFLNLV